MLDVRRLLWLMSSAIALVWASVLLDFGGAHDAKRAPSSKAAPDDPATPRRTAAAARDGNARAPEREVTAPAPPATSSAAPGSTPPPGALPRPGQGGIYVVGKAASGTRAVSTAPVGAAPVEPGAGGELPPGELGEGVLSPDYAAIEQDYVHEVRDGPWALAEEKNLRALLSTSDVAKEVVLVSCQDSVCRLVLQTDDRDAFQKLVQVEGLSEMTGLTASTPYSLRGGQLSVYFKRR
jgi:hypothetical protein